MIDNSPSARSSLLVAGTCTVSLLAYLLFSIGLHNAILEIARLGTLALQRLR